MTPEKAYCTISEAAQTLGLEKYVLRFWEGKFPQISPMKRAGGRRYYRPEDLQSIMLIKHLLYDKGMTIRGAQQLMKRKSTASLQKELESGNINSTLLAEEASAKATSPNAPHSPHNYGPAETKSILQELKDLKKLLENQPAQPLELSNETSKPQTDNS